MREEHLDDPPRARRWLSRVATTLAAWLVAFLVVLALLTLFGDELESLPPALDALVFTGVLVPLMGNLVMPVVSAAVAGWVASLPEGALRGGSKRGPSIRGVAVNHRGSGDDRVSNESRAGAVSRGMTDRNVPSSREHPRLEALPDWPTKTIAVLCTVDGTPHAIPVSAPVRADRRILLSLHQGRGSLARLRERPHVALTILAEGDIALTVRGRARIVQESMDRAPDYAAIAIDVDHIDDHRQAEFHVESGIGRQWVDEDERRALRERVGALTE